MDKRPKGRTLRVARHEAAHAVVAELLGSRVKSVVLTGNKGYCVAKSSCPVELAMIACAGKAAEELWYRMGKRSWPSEDMCTLKRLRISSESAAFLMREVRQIVSTYRAYIDNVAQHLVERDLSGLDVRKIIEGTYA